jgi:hypothetical protein
MAAYTRTMAIAALYKTIAPTNPFAARLCPSWRANAGNSNGNQRDSSHTRDSQCYRRVKR